LEADLYRIDNHIILTGQEYRKLELEWKEYLILNQRNGGQPNQDPKNKKKKKKKKDKERGNQNEIFENSMTSMKFNEDSSDAETSVIKTKIHSQSMLKIEGPSSLVKTGYLNDAKESDIYN
jgi:hypothetical protein